MKNDKTVLAWGDLETGGLDGVISCTAGGDTALGMQYYPIFELAFVMTDLNLNQLGEPLHIIVYQPESEISKCHAWALKQHTESGLLEKVRESKIGIDEVESIFIDWMNNFGVEKYDQETRDGAIFCGNSIKLDRNFLSCQLPLISQYMHYRQFDISAVALAVRFWNPKIEATVNKEYKHTALEDVRESINEGRVYRNYIQPSKSTQVQILFDVANERTRQDEKWGGPEHDDNHTTLSFIEIIFDYVGFSRMSECLDKPLNTRKRLIQVAALAVAAVESIDRKFNLTGKNGD